MVVVVVVTTVVVLLSLLPLLLFRTHGRKEGMEGDRSLIRRVQHA